ncbi:TIGR01440 family protein [Paenibacillus sp. N1-5-1-14]|uniref:TIGR01440 family protein n=1 Tax=Paenibacillus radicibacter TaxID=2972488 RepID=UPI0021594A55|nr:TIGR01440 family protein [Paenibacillus radicibacter]MCR8645101.1 TIGR01440 family protein [Paenibacillus radicibacter]
MPNEVAAIGEATEQNLRELVQAGSMQAGQLVVIGCSTSEVRGAHIGTSGTLEVAQELYQAIELVCREFGLFPAFQCCEHLNRALVVSSKVAERYQLVPVSVIPMPRAGGSMAAYAYRHLPDAVVVEHIRAHAGIDIGSTLIGMHLRPVAVPVRPSNKLIGSAYCTMAFSRPKLIGGTRAVYTLDEPQDQSTSNNELNNCL